MKDIQLTSERTDRKVSFWASVVLMIAAWFFVAALLVYLLAGRLPDVRSWETGDLGIYGALLGVLTMISIQLRLYFKPGSRGIASQENNRTA